ncbi:p23 chaperone protein wos2 [Malassezia cuniculi]|uniref:P23 chaperone protein wos2 n=1 Tax=Malassezia cuniculi TaxID=948313 RepID=A0AAF0ES82_9BASI|nr:p23 chaperone protein wos2 [Malassezia cuniculi]
MSQTRAPEILWAQRSSATDAEKNLVMLTINVPNLEGDHTKCDLTSSHLHFEAEIKANPSKGIEGHKYLFDLDFYDEIDVAQSKQHLTAKSLYIVLRKATSNAEYWPRLTKEKVRLHNVKTDFDKWVDEDEQDGEEEDFSGMGGFDPSMLAGAGGAGGMGGMGGMGDANIQEMLAKLGGGAGGAGLEGLEDDDEEDGEEAQAEEIK